MILKYKFFLERKDLDESVAIKKFKNFFLSKIKCFDDIKFLWNEKSMKRLDKRLYLVQQELKEKYK